MSKVRSLTMDDLSDNQKGVLLALGNYKVNAIYLATQHDVASENFPTKLFPNSERLISIIIQLNNNLELSVSNILRRSMWIGNLPNHHSTRL